MLEYLYHALRSKFGIYLECSNVTALRGKLYIERVNAFDPDLDVIALVISPFNPNHLWLVKRIVNVKS